MKDDMNLNDIIADLSNMLGEAGSKLAQEEWAEAHKKAKKEEKKRKKIQKLLNKYDAEKSETLAKIKALFDDEPTKAQKKAKNKKKAKVFKTFSKFKKAWDEWIND